MVKVKLVNIFVNRFVVLKLGELLFGLKELIIKYGQFVLVNVLLVVRNLMYC